MPEPTPDALIDPLISQLSALVQSGRATPENLAEPYPVPWPWVPPELLPFIQSPSLATFVEVLNASSTLFGHPLVQRQIGHLLQLSRDESAWHQLGWAPQYDAEGMDGPPVEVEGIDTCLQQVIEAYARALLP